MTNQITIETPVGYLQIEANSQGQVVELAFDSFAKSGTVFRADSAKKTPKQLRDLVNQLQKYFEGSSSSFTQSWNVASQGTPFQQAVWRVIADIPYGQVMSYKEIAETLGKPRAYRAVANACGKNPWPIVIPCHRVVGSGQQTKDGQQKYTIGGYSSGLEKKRFLMKLEGIKL